MRPEVLVAAARRFLIVLGVLGAVIVAFGLLLAAVGVASPERTVSLGFYGAGAFLVLAGFLLGNRGPYRGGRRGRIGRELQRTSPDDARELINMAILLSVLGFVLLALGVIIDSRFHLI